MSGQKRIQKELSECSKNAPTGIKVELAGESLYKWNVIITGPDGSPYKGGHFKIRLDLPTEYPFKPPTISFATKIYHPNVTNDDKGSICLGMLRPDQWKPPNQIMAVLNLLKSILEEPNLDYAVEGAIANQYKTDRKTFDKIAKEWTAKYATS